MVLIRNHKQLYSSHYLKGHGFAQKQIYGSGIATYTPKTLGRQLLKFGKLALRNHLIPAKWTGAKDREANVLSQQSKNILDGVKNKEILSAKCRKILNDILSEGPLRATSKRIEGSGIKTIRNPYKH